MKKPKLKKTLTWRAFRKSSLQKRHNLSEGRKMYLSVMAMFFIYLVLFLILDDVNRRLDAPFNKIDDWHLVVFGIVSMLVLSVILHKYATLMDKRISDEHVTKGAALRRQLTQNISHELKTPVTSIMGYVETILENPDIEQQKLRMFVERAYNQAYRLSSLLDDLSTLNKMDYAKEIYKTERVDIAEIVSHIGEETSLMLKKHNIMWRNCLPGTVIVNGIYALIYSIFRNLVDNAINYAGDGIAIEITAIERPDKWEFEVSDNGIGIPEEHRTRIFERFYRVDKGRSRVVGGTGLGLAIVKNAVIMHGGIISAEQNNPSGVKFVFTLRK